MDGTTVGIDLAKNVFQVAISNRGGQVAARHRWSRRKFAAFVETLEPGTIVVMEACSMAHYWGRRCQDRGVAVRLLPHIHGFRRGRHFASWLGLTPLEYSSGHQRSLGHISKRGDCYWRCLLVHGARAVLRVAELRVRQGDARATAFHRWAAALAQRSGRNRAAVAVANKLARYIWAVWTRDVDFAAATPSGSRIYNRIRFGPSACREEATRQREQNGASRASRRAGLWQATSTIERTDPGRSLICPGVPSDRSEWRSALIARRRERLRR